MRFSTRMLWLLLLAATLVAGLTEELRQLQLRQNLFDAALNRLSNNVHQFEELLVGSIILYPNRQECPPHTRPATELDGKLPVVGLQEIGRVSAHSLHSSPVYSLNATCQSYLDVGEMGFKAVCKGGHDYELDMKDALPTFSVLACIWDNDIVYEDLR